MENYSLRIDSEFFKKIALKIEEKIKNRKFFYLDRKRIVSGPFGSTLKSSAYLQQGDVAFVRIENINSNFFINIDNLVYISKSDNSRIINSQLQQDDIVVSKVGSIGRFASVDEDIGTCNISENNIGIKLCGMSEYRKYYILDFLNSKYGNILINRRRSGNVQPKLNVDDLSQIPIPKFTDRLEKAIYNVVKNAKNARKDALCIYKQAEELLLKELGLDNFNPISQTSSIKSLKDSFYATGRLDSEYYQIKYDEYLNKIYNYSGGYELLIDCCVLKDSNYTPNPDGMYRYIELSNIRNNLEITNNGLTSGRDLPTRARRKIFKGDVIVSSIEGSLNSCGLINDEEDNILCSTGFYVIGSSKINPESLLVLFKSKLMFNLMKKGCSGTILTNIAKDEFLKLPIPILDNFLQANLSNLISKSLEYLNKSKSLLEASTKAVEIAIEDSEDKALEFLSTYFDRYE